MERGIAYLIAAILAVAIIGTLAALFGGAALAALAAVVAFPLAFPLTTAAIVVVVIAVAVWQLVRKSRR